MVDEIVEGVHDPSTMPFTIEWTDIPSPRRERESLQWFWRQRAEWSPGKVDLQRSRHRRRAPRRRARPVGARTSENSEPCETGSWLGIRHQGRGIGKEMRAAILHLAFAGLGAVEANSGAWHDNTLRSTSRGLSATKSMVKTSGSGEDGRNARSVCDSAANHGS